MSDAPDFFYVSAINGARKHIVAGPYLSHDAALARVEAVRELANERDPMSWFFAWGTCGAAVWLETPLGPDWSPDRGA